MNAWALPTLFALLLQLWLNFYALNRRPLRPLSPVLHGLLFSALLFTVGDLLASSFLRSSEERWVGFFFLYSGLIFLGPAWWLLALRFSEAHELGLKFTRKRWTYLPLAVAIGLWAGLVLNPWHGQFLTPVVDGASVRHWMWWANATQSYLILVGVSGLYGFLVFKTPPGVLRSRLIILLLATLSTGLASAFYVFAPVSIPFDPTSIGVGISSLLFIIGIYRTRLFALSPVAWREVMKHQPGGILVFGTEGQLLYANANALKILGDPAIAASAPILPLLARVLHPPEDPSASLDPENLKRTLVGSENPGPGHLFRYGNEGKRWLRVFAAPIPNRRGSVRAWSLHLQDETLLQCAAQSVRDNQVALSRTQKLESLGVMAGGIAHDFNNILQGVLGNTDLALDEAPEQAPFREFLHEIEASALRAKELVGLLLLYSGNSPVKKEIVEIDKLLDGARDSVQQLTRDNIRVEWSVESSLPPIRAHLGQLQQALKSLVANASEAIDEDPGEITIDASLVRLDSERAQSLRLYDCLTEGEYICLEVHDSGPGVKTEIGERVFEPFFSTKFAGRGLGLPAVTGIVRGHGGSIGYKNSNGQGTTFSIYLPTANPLDLPVETEALAKPLPACRDRVLVIDDEASVRSICSRALRRTGLRVEEATSGGEALAIQKKASFGLAIVDLTMPGIDGIETTRRLRSRDPEIRVILSSGFNDLDLEYWDDPDLADAFLHKPYRAHELVELVQKVLGEPGKPPRGLNPS